MSGMKLITAIVQDEDAGRLLKALVGKEYGATKIASTGGLLRRGNAILLVGVEEEKVDDVLGVIKETCQTRRKAQANAEAAVPFLSAEKTKKIEVGGAVVMVTAVERYHRI